MRRRVGVIGIVALVSVLIFGVVPAQAELSVGGMAGYYNPEFGEVNDRLEEFNKRTGTDLKFKGGLAYGLTLSYDISPNLRIRGEYNTFTSKTSDSYTDSYYDCLGDLWEDEYNYEEKLAITPIVLSGIYRFSPDSRLCPYVGAGIGSFPTKYSYDAERKKYCEGYLDDTDTWSGSDEDSPIGFQVLGGVEFGGKKFSLAAEVRYITAKATSITETKFDVDLGGFFAGLVASIKF
ncbi:MAG: outer membrane beta-barrel protein [Candidatus Aerophobetes bacterium]|nr:outer membrane beta-barrel protein [Candidatus Aerophobetes bacterium]